MANKFKKGDRIILNAPWLPMWDGRTGVITSRQNCNPSYYHTVLDKVGFSKSTSKTFHEGCLKLDEHYGEHNMNNSTFKIPSSIKTVTTEVNHYEGEYVNVPLKDVIQIIQTLNSLAGCSFSTEQSLDIAQRWNKEMIKRGHSV